MKSKKAMVFIIIINVLIIIGLIYSYNLLYHPKVPRVISQETLKKYIENNKCKLSDLKANKDIKGVDFYLTTKGSNCPYLIEYLNFNKSEVVLEYYFNYKDEVLKNKDIDERVDLSFEPNYREFSTEGKLYKIVTLNNNSILYASAPKKYSQKIIDIFTKFQYRYVPNKKGRIISQIAIYMIYGLIFGSYFGLKKKIDNKWWIMFIPFYNLFSFSKDILGNGWYSLIFYIPGVNFVFWTLFNYNIPLAFEETEENCALAAMIPTIILPKFVFDNSTYIKPSNDRIKEYCKTSFGKWKEYMKNFSFKGRFPRLKRILKCFKVVMTAFNLFLIFPAMQAYFKGDGIEYIFGGLAFLIFGLMGTPIFKKWLSKYSFYLKYKCFFSILYYLILLLEVVYIVMLPIE